MRPSTVSALLFLSAGVQAAPTATLALRDSDVGQLYAYGTDIDGVPVFACDGKALIGASFPSSCSSAFNVSFTLTDTLLMASPVSSSNTTTQYLYIKDGAEEWAPAGFIGADDNSTAVTTDGFFMFGPSVAKTTDDDGIAAAWYAVAGDDTGVLALTWNTPNNSPNSSAVPIVIKNTAPTS